MYKRLNDPSSNKRCSVANDIAQRQNARESTAKLTTRRKPESTTEEISINIKNGRRVIPVPPDKAFGGNRSRLTQRARYGHSLKKSSTIQRALTAEQLDVLLTKPLRKGDDTVITFRELYNAIGDDKISSRHALMQAAKHAGWTECTVVKQKPIRSNTTWTDMEVFLKTHGVPQGSCDHFKGILNVGDPNAQIVVQAETRVAVAHSMSVIAGELELPIIGGDTIKLNQVQDANVNPRVQGTRQKELVTRQAGLAPSKTGDITALFEIVPAFTRAIMPAEENNVRLISAGFGNSKGIGGAWCLATEAAVKKTKSEHLHLLYAGLKGGHHGAPGSMHYHIRLYGEENAHDNANFMAATGTFIGCTFDHMEGHGTGRSQVASSKVNHLCNNAVGKQAHDYGFWEGKWNLLI